MKEQAYDRPGHGEVSLAPDRPLAHAVNDAIGLDMA